MHRASFTPDINQTLSDSPEKKMTAEEMREANRELIDRIDEAILCDDPQQIIDLKLSEQQIVNFIY